VLKIIEPEPLYGLVPFFSALALIVILFSGGLQLNIYKVISQLKKATYFTLASYTITSLAVAAASFAVFGLDTFRSLFLGVVFGGTCSTIVSALFTRMRAAEENRTMLVLESTFTDALSIVLAITIIQMMLAPQAIGFSSTLNQIASAFSIAIVVGAIVGITWLGVLRDLRVRPFGYLLTLAAAFVLYGAVELAKGNGAIATLVFGLVLGNAPEISSMLKLHAQFELDKTIKQFQNEVAFFVRTFFFVYLGINFRTTIGWQVGVFSALVVAAILASRIVAVEFFARPTSKKTRVLYTLLVPRGLAAAVLATLPLAMNIRFENIVEISMLVIVLTNVLTAAGVFAYGAREREAREERREAGGTKIRRPAIVGIR